MRLSKLLSLSVCPIAIVAVMAPAFAQSTGTEAVETVVVTGTKLKLSGVMNAVPVAKEKSIITSDFLETQTSGQTVFQSLNFMPGVNFTNNDPYGTSGGNIRMHGQDGNHISLTLDGMPLNYPFGSTRCRFTNPDAGPGNRGPRLGPAGRDRHRQPDRGGHRRRDRDLLGQAA